jgi:DNA-binding MarR family transcriptional regulator
MKPPELAEALHLLVAELDQEAEYLLQRQHGISHSQLAFMAPLLREGPLDATSLAERMGVSVPAVSKRIGWFGERGYIRVDRDSAPGRRITLELTEVGAAVTTEAISSLEVGLARLLTDFPAADRDQFHVLVLSLLAHVRSLGTHELRS